MREGACTVIAGKSKNDFSLTILQQKQAIQKHNPFMMTASNETEKKKGREK